MTTLQLGMTRTRVELLTFRRQTDSAIFSFLLPVLMLTIFSVVFSDPISFHRTGNVSEAQYLLPGFLAAGIGLVSFQTLAIAVVLERADGTLKRLAASPLPPASYFLGKCGMVLVTAAAQSALLIAVAKVCFGVALPDDPARWVTFGWVFTLGILSGGLLGIAYAAVPRSPSAVGPVVAGPVLLLQFISGVYFSFPDLPPWLRDVAAAFPLKWLAQGMRSAFLPDSFRAAEAGGSWDRPLVALVLGAWAVVGLALCLRTFRWTTNSR